MDNEARIIAYVGMWGAIVASLVSLVIEDVVLASLFLLVWLAHFIMFLREG